MKLLERKKLFFQVSVWLMLFHFSFVIVVCFFFLNFLVRSFCCRETKKSVQQHRLASKITIFLLQPPKQWDCKMYHHSPHHLSVAYFQHIIQLAIFLNIGRMLISFSSLSHNNPLFSHRAKAKIFMRSESCPHDISCGLSLASHIFLSVFLLLPH